MLSSVWHILNFEERTPLYDGLVPLCPLLRDSTVNESIDALQGEMFVGGIGRITGPSPALHQELAEAITRNTRRYVSIFSDAITELLPMFKQREVRDTWIGVRKM